MPRRTALRLLLGISTIGLAIAAGQTNCAGDEATEANAPAVYYRTIPVDGLDIFYREAGPKDAPTVLLLHGFPSSSFMFRNLIPRLASRYHVVAPDYPGFGQSSAPDAATFHYSFDHLANVVDKFTQALKLERFALYVQDYGAPIGYRIASAHPERITGIVVQNGNAYVDGLPDPYWKPIKAYWADPSPEARKQIAAAALTLEGFKSQYLIGVKDPSAISPDTWTLDLAYVNRSGNKDSQLDLLLDYQNNLPLYPKWQEYFRKSQPPMLIVWGKNDVCFPAAGAEAYKRDIKDLEFHLLDTGHFALEDSANEIATLMLAFLDRQTRRNGVDSKPPVPSAATDSSTPALTAAEAKFKVLLTNATLKGRWTPIKNGEMGEEKEDKYAIAGVSKVKDDSWIIGTKMKYGDHEIVAPIPVRVKWAGDTPVIIVDKITIPGGGTYSARVLFFEKTYSGSWSSENHAGLLNGTISNKTE